MHIDLDHMEQPIAPIQSQVCIIGAGVAGLVAASRLVDGGMDVILLEAGGLALEERSQRFYDPVMVGATHTGSTAGRFRVFGGSSTRWGGQLLPYTPDIFEPPAGAPSPPWPIRDSDLAPFYPAVERLMEVDDLPFSAELLPALGHPLPPFPPEIELRFSKWAPFGRRNLARTVGKAILRHPRIRVFTHANVASLQPTPNGRVQGCEARDYAGRVFQFQAEAFIVASGTIESCRLLLASGLSDPHDQIGRYFHDHVSFHAAHLTSPARENAIERLGPFFVRGTLHTAKLEASPVLRVRAGLPAIMAHFAVEEPPESGVAAVRNLLQAVQRGKLRSAISSNLLPAMHGSYDVARLLWNARIRKRRAVSRRATLWLNIDLEQFPDPENRIQLSDSRDALGLRRAVVKWRVGAREGEAACRFSRVVKAALEQAGIAPLEWKAGLLQGEAPEMVDTYHAMGGLRMGTDPRVSVTGPSLQVHGAENLYVLSCATYPSGGSSNPTFTLMALALRLADRLLSRR
jgi:choline dehydrogenase-like flavoprotein